MTDPIDGKFNELVKKVKSYNPRADELFLKKAWEFAKLAHSRQKRLSGEDFINHPLQVALKLADWKLDTQTLVAALLHDSVEDGGATKEDLVKEFGEEVALLVDGVTKISGYHLKENKEEEFVENLRKMLLVIAKDVRVVLLKLADRAHNMETLWPLPKKKQVAKSKETLEIYAPLAERLGIGEVKGYLEDLAFPYVYPKEFQILKKESAPFYKEAEKSIEKMRRVLLRRIGEGGIRATIQGRKKHLYSLWKKLERPEIDGDFSKVYDVVALRILVTTVPECYTVLGVVHGIYKPVPHIGVSDFIAQPKPNGYKSIHTKVFGPGGRIVEVQIRTFEMHSQAESGIAAHWSYAETKKKGASDKKLEKGVFAPVEKLSWVRQLLEWQQEISDSEEFLKAVKFDALNHRNFIFSPKGDVYDLPAGATPVDFAYAVHTDLGNQMIMAKVGGKMVPLSEKLKSGQVVEIIKSKNPKGPSRDWLAFVGTQYAKSQINRYYRKLR